MSFVWIGVLNLEVSIIRPAIGEWTLHAVLRSEILKLIHSGINYHFASIRL